MLTNFRVGDCVEDKETHKRGYVTFVYSELERKGEVIEVWPAPGSEDTELGVLMEPEVGHGETEVYARVQA